MSKSLPNTQPIYTREVTTGFVELITQTAGRDPGAANLPILFEATDAGALIELVQVVYLGDEATPSEVRFYRRKTDQDKANLFATLPINTVTLLGNKTTGEVTWASLNSAVFKQDLTMPSILFGTNKTAIRLEPYEILYCALSTALTNGVNVFAYGGQYA